MVLPRYIVYAIAVNDLGNRWFGGDRGLSRLDQSGRWRHFDSQNSGLYADIVDGLAVDDSGAVWAGHGAVDTQISRRTADGSYSFELFGDVGVRSHAEQGAILVIDEIHRLFLASIYTTP